MYYYTVLKTLTYTIAYLLLMTIKDPLIEISCIVFMFVFFSLNCTYEKSLISETLCKNNPEQKCEKKNTFQTCYICYQNNTKIHFFPMCSHGCCLNCYHNLLRFNDPTLCPICRTPI